MVFSDSISYRDKTMKLKCTFIQIIILMGLKASANASLDFNTKSAQVEFVDVYDQYLNQNYYLTKCQNDEASNKAIKLVTLQIIKNQNKNTYYLNFEVKTKPSVELNLIFKNKKINVSQTTNNSFVFSLQKNDFTDQESLATLEVSSQNITSVLELRFDSVKQLATLNPIEQSILSKNLCLKNYIWFGLGFSYFNHDQTLQDNQIKVKYQSQLQNGLLFGFRKTLTQNFGIYGSMIKNSGKVDKAQISNVTTDGLNQMSWSHYELGTEYMINMPKLIYTYLLIPYFSFGLVKYETQRVAIDNNDNATFRNLDSYHASLGLGFKAYSLNNYFFDTRLSYKPLLSSPNHSTSSNLIYSVSLGLGKAFNKFSLGFFWEGNQVSTKYKESSGPDTNEGQLNNLYSDLSLQAGFFF